ncbi:glutathione peroxidase [Candidimonas sp. SYP-B2681]|uniref:glutathione peroxidase n=1 Tax=Candidimonas sp. SYP-B2681 TaxID=2497686 RepID=UPI000F866F35|nr:glutathione peroxidase [Candidimonas sp. SYP-B2681]RTZ47975.1 glutathione peroxidase [Candidimonas sp. SYP-B2681]
MTSIFSFSARALNGESIELSRFEDQVLLVVNVASECGFTPQYHDLEALYREYVERGFAVLGFPCDQFGNQEPGSADEIADFCSRNYGVTFPMFQKIDVNGPQAHPLFTWLKSEKAGVLGSQNIKWNFTKFLLGRDGKVLNRYGSMTKPPALRSDIEKALASRP